MSFLFHSQLHLSKKLPVAQLAWINLRWLIVKLFCGEYCIGESINRVLLSQNWVLDIFFTHDKKQQISLECHSYFLFHYSINSVLSIISIRALMSILECLVVFKSFRFAQMPSHIALFLEVAQVELYCLLLWDVSPNISCNLLWFLTQTALFSHLHTMSLICKVFWYPERFSVSLSEFFALFD